MESTKEMEPKVETNRSDDTTRNVAKTGSGRRVTRSTRRSTRNRTTESSREETEADVEIDVVKEDEVELELNSEDAKSAEKETETSSNKPYKTKRTISTHNNINSNVKKSNLFKGKSRRALLKRAAIKAPSAVARIHTSDRVFYNNQWFSKGDIVSCRDLDDDDDSMLYYAQIRGFLVDQYCEKSCVITWLLPTLESPIRGFDPNTFIVGPEEELPRRLDCFEFVMHAPSDYFLHRNAPYPTQENVADMELVHTRHGPKIRMVREEPKDSGARRAFHRQPRP